MSTSRAPLAVALLLAAGALAGCVQPGRIDATLLNRYRRAMQARGPQQRRGTAGLGQLQPARTAAPNLPAEPILWRRTIVTTTTTHELLDADGARASDEAELHRFAVRKTIEVETTEIMFEVDPRTLRERPVDRRHDVRTRTEQEELFEVQPGRPSMPEDTVEVEVSTDRVGRRSWRRSLGGARRTMIHLDLEQAVHRALANHPAIRAISYDPAISREEMVAAAAAFDAVVFGGFNYERTDERSSSIFGGGQTDTQGFEAGVRQTTPTGGSWSASYAFSRVWDSSGFTTMVHEYEPTLLLEVSQPLLRDAWPAFNLAELRIARTNRRVSQAEFRRQVEETITSVVTTYWSLVRARRALEIQESLLAMTKETLDRVRLRKEIDATAVQIKQAEAAVASRRAQLLRARKEVFDVQDALMRLLSDPQANLLADAEVLPTTAPAREPVHVSVGRQLLSALEHNPVLEQARLAVALADINVTVAENQALPRLDLTGSVGYQGLGGARHEAHEKLGTLDYLSYSIGISVEYPFGNRQRRADLRKAHFERLKSVAQLQDAADELAQQIQERIRQIRTDQQEVLLQQAAVDAAKVQLQALEDTEKHRGQLTPEFLELKLGAQESLAAAELAELDAVVSYNAALAQLDQLTGTVLASHRVRVDLPGVLGEAPWPLPQAPDGPGPENGR
jgi:outer membrane protein TolC